MIFGIHNIEQEFIPLSVVRKFTMSSNEVLTTTKHNHPIDSCFDLKGVFLVHYNKQLRVSLTVLVNL